MGMLIFLLILFGVLLFLAGIAEENSQPGENLQETSKPGSRTIIDGYWLDPEDDGKENLSVEGDFEMETQNTWKQNGKVNAGQVPPQSAPLSHIQSGFTEKILAAVPASERAKFQPMLSAVIADFVREVTSMGLDANLRLREFELGTELAEKELEISLKSSQKRFEMFCTGWSKLQAMAAQLPHQAGQDSLIQAALAIYGYNLLREAFKGQQLPPGMTLEGIASTLALPFPAGYPETIQGVVVKDEVNR